MYVHFHLRFPLSVCDLVRHYSFLVTFVVNLCDIIINYEFRMEQKFLKCGGFSAAELGYSTFSSNWLICYSAGVDITLVWRQDCCQVAAVTHGPRTTRHGRDFCSVSDVTGSSAISSLTASTRHVGRWTSAYSWLQYGTCIRHTRGGTWQHIEALFHCHANHHW